MTNGIVSVLKNGEVALKVVAGCDGYNADALAGLLTPDTHPEVAWRLALEAGFGCEDCLVVQHPGGDVYRGEGELNPLYRERFSDPRFNPRWECGLCGHVRVVGEAS